MNSTSFSPQATNREMNQVQMRQIVQPQNVNQPNIEQELADENRQNVQLVQQNNNNQNIVEIPLNRSPICSKNRKSVLILFVSVCIIIVGINYLVSDKLIKSRQPMSMSSMVNNNAAQVSSPLQNDYTSHEYFQKLDAIARKAAAQNREPTEQQLKQFQDMDIKQFYSMYKVSKLIQASGSYARTQAQLKQRIKPQYQQNEDLNLNSPVNFREELQDAVNQFSCSSCYSFPITATIEFQYKHKYNIDVKLSEQQLIDCAHPPNEDGCNSGNITRGFEYARDVGLTATQDYPYRSMSGNSFKCNKTTEERKKKYKISGFKMLPPGNCQAIQSELVKGNVVASMIHAGRLFEYTEGTFTECKRSGLNHAITIVGQTEKNQWIVRNSWGKNWGDDGYFVMAHGNTCGICSWAIVPILNMENGQVIPWNPQEDRNKEKQDI